ncbi:tRNA (N(6)-L-threonylcarbamoyladenosine(37)-C(2))-methylthiotransferase MtaB [Chloroflexota bacterium]
MKIALETLGCKLNQAETEFLARQFTEAGHRLVSSVGEADIYILNTCTVTHIADAKSRHLLRLAHRRNPEALVVATGCYAQRVPQELAKVDEVKLVVGNDEKLRLLPLLEESGYLSSLTSTRGDYTANYEPVFRTRAFIKIQDGCNSFCSYCIVPLVRGSEKSLSVDQVVTEVRHRLAGGVKEVVLTGTEIGSYNYNGINLKGLLEHILAETEVTRLRLSSLQPQEISSGFIDLWRDQRLCPHFHLALQSGSDRVLRQMKRHYSVSDYQKAISLIRALVPDAAITTDIIVGFPGETEEDFKESHEFCQRLEFTRIHVFIYSSRKGTQATLFPHQISAQVKKQRSQKILALAGESTQNFRQRFLGRNMLVLWEQQSDGIWSGHTGNYIKVYTQSNDDLTNQLLPVKLVKLFNRDGVWGETTSLVNKLNKEYNAAI